MVYLKVPRSIRGAPILVIDIEFFLVGLTGLGLPAMLHVVWCVSVDFLPMRIHSGTSQNQCCTFYLSIFTGQ